LQLPLSTLPPPSRYNATDRTTITIA